MAQHNKDRVTEVCRDPWCCQGDPGGRHPHLIYGGRRPPFGFLKILSFSIQHYKKFVNFGDFTNS